MTTVDDERSDRLRSIDLTSGLDRVALARLAGYMSPLPVSDGQVICAEGDIGNTLYIVVRGRFGGGRAATGGAPVVLQFVLDGKVLTEVVERNLSYSIRSQPR